METTSQTALWNGLAGRAWVEAQELLDLMFRPFADLLIEALRPGSRVLDVGCGAGSTTLAAARRVGPEGRAVGIDISDPLISAARARAEREAAPARFILADAQTHLFEPAAFDQIISRFGVMFFDDPIRAFANLRHAASDTAALRLIAFRAPDENPFMTAAERAAAPLLPNLPIRRPGAPGQFAFADPQYVRNILEKGGWDGIEIQSIDRTCAFPAKDLDMYLTRLGPIGLIIQEADEPTRAQLIETVRRAFDPYICGTEVRFTAACWMVDAQAA